MASTDEQDRIAPGAFDRVMQQPTTHQLEHFGRKLRGSFVPDFAPTWEHQPPPGAAPFGAGALYNGIGEMVLPAGGEIYSLDNVSHETPYDPGDITRHQIREITAVDLTHVALLPGGQFGIAYTVRGSAPEPFTITAYTDTSQSPSREQEPPRSKPLPATPARPETDERRTHRPGQPRPGEQSKPAPNRQVRPK